MSEADPNALPVPPSQTPEVDAGDVLAPAEVDPLLGSVIHGRYEILRELGWGSLGRVYLARDRMRPPAHNELALKVVRLDRLTPQSVAFLRHEFRALSGLRHPHVARVYDLDVVPAHDSLFFSMDHLPGRTIVEVARDLGWRKAVPLFVQTLRALAFVHARGLLHMDVKPKNLLVLDEGGPAPRVQLLDFHLARERDARSEGTLRGTVAYMAPEVVRGEPVDPRADLYSFGAVAYEAITGSPPFGGRESVMDVLRGHAGDAPPSFAERGVEAPPAVEAIVMRLLSKTREERFPSGNEVIRAINLTLGERFELETTETLESYLSSGRFVGRARELEAIEALARDLGGDPTEGDSPAGPPVVRVIGEAGIGKTRVLAELKTRLQIGGLPALLERPSRLDAGAYGPFARALTELLRRVGRETLLAQVAPEGGPLEPDLLLVARGAQENLPAPVRRTAAFADLLRELAQACPFALILDDLQDTNAETHELLRALASGPRFPALLVVGQLADADLEPLGPPRRVLDVHLNRLTRTATGELLAAKLGVRDAPAEFVTRLWEVTGGNPRFVEETLRNLAETGAIRSHEGALAIGSEAAETLLPELSLGALTRKRLERLPEQAGILLAALAASPRPRPLPFAAAIAGLGLDDARAAVRELERRGFVSRLEIAGARHAELLVEHEPLREAALSALAPEAARALHAKAARLLETRHPVTLLAPGSDSGGGVRDRAEELHWHHDHAGSLKAALRYAVEAGEAARARQELRRARRQFAAALDLFTRRSAAGESVDASEELRLTLRLAECLAATGERDRAIAQLSLLDAPLLRCPQGLRLRAAMHTAQGQFAAALLDLERAGLQAAEAEDQGEPNAGLETARCLAQRCRVHLWTADYAQARADGEEALERLLGVGAPLEDELSLLDALHHACHFAGDDAASADYLRRALRRQNERSERVLESGRLPRADAVEADAMPFLGDAAGVHVPGSLVEAAFARADRGRDLVDHCRRRVRLLEAAGDVDGAAYARLNLAHLRRAHGQIERAANGYREARAQFERVGCRIGVAVARLSLARLLASVAEAEGASEEARAAEGLARELGARWLEGYARLARAEAARAAENPAALSEALGAASELSEAIGNRPLMAELALFRARVARDEGDPRRARRELQAFEASPESARSAPLRIRADLLVAELPDTLLETRERMAGSAFDQAERRGWVELSWRAALVRADARRERGDTAGELDDLVACLEALRTFTDGMPKDLRSLYLSLPACATARERFAQVSG